MQSKAILLSILFSTVILSLSLINVNTHNLPLKVSYDSLNKETQKQVTCLADNIYFEAAHEPLNGKKAVAFVTINRVMAGNYKDDVCGVVYQKTGNTCQFSWYCDSKFTSKTLTIRDTMLYNEIRDIAINIFINFERHEDITEGATYYHADYVNPGWNLQRVKKIGRHIFYRSKKDQIDKNRGFN